MAKTGLMLLALGVGVLITAYALRPPASIGESLQMVFDRTYSLREPVYYAVLGLGGFLVLIGLVVLVRPARRRSSSD